MNNACFYDMEISKGLVDFQNERSYYDMQIYKTIKYNYLGNTSRNQNKIGSYNLISYLKIFIFWIL